MPSRLARRFRLLVLAVVFACLTTALAPLRALGDVSFNRDIRPILSDKCFHCHGFDEHDRQADLRLDTAEGAMAAITPGDPDDSEVLRRVQSDDEYEVMPPPDSHKEPLNADQIELVRQWIEEGAVYEDHWAFVKPTRPAAPQADSSTESVSKAIDALVGAQHQARGLQFATPATPAKWLRRMMLDLTGLPPTPADYRAFERDLARQGEDAYAHVVNRTMQSPHYGERMALEWLDVARYADTNGFQVDAYRMNWPWRDWVVDAFNENMPFDRFTIEQLAGDLLDSPSRSQLIATAFNRNHMINGEGGAIREENLAKTVFDRVETTSTAWLGLTMGCCQCHDHKFDPLKQSEYYAFYAFFNQLDEKAQVHKQFSAKKKGQNRSKKYMIDKPYLAVATEAQTAELKELGEDIKSAESALEAERPIFEPEFVRWVTEMRADPTLVKERVKEDYLRRSVNTVPLDKPNNSTTKRYTTHFLSQDERWAPLVKAIKDASRAESEYQAEVPLVMIMRDNKPRDTFLLERGNYETPGEQVTAGVPSFLPPLPKGMKPDRLALAEWMVSDENPLTSRVTVNRYWQLLFGRGLVTTPDDFGLQGALPSHPQLLDWLAVEFIESGWDVKSLLKAIVLSRTYRQSAEVNVETFQRDEDNRWLTRGPRQRLDSRLLRDQALAISGLLNTEVGGWPVAPYQPPGIWAQMSLGKTHYERDEGEDLYRRSLYTVWRRVVAPANFFDVPSRQICSVKPQRTNTPLHALTLLNDPTYVEAARVWAERLAQIDNESERLRHAFKTATARPPTTDELASLTATLREARTHYDEHPGESRDFLSVGESKSKAGMKASEHAAWTTVCLLVLNLDETLSK